MHVDLKKWYRCEIDKQIFKELLERSDLKGAQHVLIFFTLLIISGYLAYITWGSFWSVFWFLVYGNIYSFSNAIWHETGHKTAFKSKILNEIFYHISCYMSFFEPTRWRYTHFIHHGNTYSTENPYDHEIEFSNNAKTTPIRLLLNIIPFAEIFNLFNSNTGEITKHALGIKTKIMMDSIPEPLRPRCILISRIYVSIWISIALISLIINSWLPVLYFLLPQFYGKTLHKLVSFAQHAGLARDVKDHRLSARDMHLNPILSFLYWKMEYHCVHHIYPTIPSYNLDKLYFHLKDQLPEAKNGLIDAYSEIIPALIKQIHNPKYSIDINLPENEKTTT